MNDLIKSTSNLLPNADNIITPTTPDYILHLLQLIPIIIGLLFGKQYIDKKKRQKQKLAQSTYIPEVEFIQTDERACFPVRDPISIGYTLHSRDLYIIPAGQRQTIPTGIAAWLPRGYYGRFTNLQSNTIHGIIVADIPYDNTLQGGEITVLLVNTTKFEYTICQGQGICQLILESALIAPIKYTNYEEHQEIKYGRKSTQIQQRHRQQQSGRGDLQSGPECTDTKLANTTTTININDPMPN
jgi:dUTPase